jgi:hypothetical protein
MNSNKIKYLINIGMGFSFLTSFVTGLIKYPGLLPRLGFDYFGWPLGAISLVHEWSGITMGAFVFLHLVLNRKWIIDTTKKIFKPTSK